MRKKMAAKKKKITLPAALFEDDKPAKRKPGRPKKVTAEVEAPKKRPGRPKGSKNKSKVETTQIAPKRRGRPPGSKNKASLMAEDQASSDVEIVPKKQRKNVMNAKLAEKNALPAPQLILELDPECTLGDLVQLRDRLESEKMVKTTFARFGFLSVKL